MIIAGTGHRPKYLPCKYDENHPWLFDLKCDLNNKLLEHKPEFVISGMALGWDTWLAEQALDIGIPVHCYIPFKEQGSNWPQKSKDRYLDIVRKATSIVYTSNEYHKDCFKIRDDKMVDDADMLFALYNTLIFKSGTGMTVRYAESKNKPIHNFWR
jgi:uncharacterized phage-like protein YoqJ